MYKFLYLFLQYINELDDLIDWFDNGDKQLKSFDPISNKPEKLQEQLKETKVGLYQNVNFISDETQKSSIFILRNLS